MKHSKLVADKKVGSPKARRRCSIVTPLSSTSPASNDPQTVQWFLPRAHKYNDVREPLDMAGSTHENPITPIAMIACMASYNPGHGSKGAIGGVPIHVYEMLPATKKRPSH